MNKALETLYPILLLLVFSLLFFTSLQNTVVLDYDEAAYAEVSRVMYQKGELLIPELHGEGFFEKPPLLYWTQMLGFELFGVTSLGVRFGTALAAVATLIVFYFGAATPLGRRTACNATLILGSSIIFTWLARVALPDMLLSLFATLALISFWYAVERAMQNLGGAALFWLGCLSAALAMLSGGTSGGLLVIFAMLLYLISLGRPFIFFRRKWFLPGAAILVLIGFSWYLLLGIFHPAGFDFMKELFIRHHLDGFPQAMESQTGILFYYPLFLLAGLMPWFGYLPLAVFHMGFSLKPDSGLRFERLFVILSLVLVIFYAIAPSRLSGQILPVLPGCALLLARLFSRETIRRPLIWRVAGWISVIPVVLLGMALASAPLVFPYLQELLGEAALQAPALAESVNLGWTPYLAALLFFAAASLLIRAIGKNQPARLFENLVLCSLINGCTLVFLIMPLYNRVFSAPLARLAEQAAEQTPVGGSIVMYAIDNRPSVNFITGRDTVTLNRYDHRQLQERLAQPDTAIGLTSVFYFEQLREQSIPLVELARDTGFVLFSLPEEQSSATL